MYSSLVDMLMILGVVQGAFVALGIFAGVIAFVVGILWCVRVSESEWDFKPFMKLDKERDEDAISGRRALRWIFVCVVLCALSIIVCSSKFLKPEWQIARAVAKQVDAYVESNPEAHTNPDNLIGHMDKTVGAIFESIQAVPELVKGLAGGTACIQERQAVRQQNKDMEAFQRFLEFQKQLEQSR